MSRWASTHRGESILLLVAGLFLLNVVLRGPIDEIERVANQESALEDVIDLAMARGMTQDQVSCFVDGVEDQFGAGLDIADVSTADVRDTLALTAECMGADLGGDECVLDSVIEIMGLDDLSDASDFVEAESSLDAGDRERMAEASLQCQGASAEVASCVTDAMREEFGEDVFESRTGPGLSDEVRQRIEVLNAECATSDPSEAGHAVLNGPCAEFSARLEEVQSDDLGGSMEEVLDGIADRADELFAVADGAPAVIQQPVRTIAVKLAGIADALDELGGIEIAFDDVEGTDDITDRYAAAMDAWGQDGNDAVYAIGDYCDLLEVSETLEDDAYTALFAPGGEMDAFARHGLVGIICIYGHCGSQTGGLGGLLGEGAWSGMDDEAQDCWEAVDALDPGDDPGCDELYEACAGGNVLACNDLSENATDGGENARFGNTCGDRASTPDLEYLGRCELLASSRSTSPGEAQRSVAIWALSLAPLVIWSAYGALVRVRRLPTNGR